MIKRKTLVQRPTLHPHLLLERHMYKLNKGASNKSFGQESHRTERQTPGGLGLWCRLKLWGAGADSGARADSGFWGGGEAYRRGADSGG